MYRYYTRTINITKFSTINVTVKRYIYRTRSYKPPHRVSHPPYLWAEFPLSQHL